MSHHEQDHEHSLDHPGIAIPAAPAPEFVDRHGRCLRNTDEDQDWADLLSPSRRRLFASAGAAAGGLAVAAVSGNAFAAPQSAHANPPESGLRPVVPPRAEGKSPWGYDTWKEPTPRPVGVRPGEQALPDKPRPYTAIKSYHAHFYFDEDTYEKAALLRKWSAERFPVELGNWNLEPRGPHVTPSFFFGFTNDLLPIIVPWLQLNSLGLTILLHPNTGDGRADHLYYALWVNRSQPVNAYNWPKPRDGGPEPLEQVYPNVVPTVPVET